MPSFDISRYLHPPARHYVGARMQQGRVVLDSDFNEEAQLDDEDQRRALVDVIGSAGSPDNGFALDLVPGSPLPATSVHLVGGQVSALNFGILPGSFYLGGWRF